jgi:hypothetical protein
MPGSMCQYFNCGKSSSKFPNLKFYRFPKDSRLEMWKINSGIFYVNIIYASFMNIFEKK